MVSSRVHVALDRGIGLYEVDEFPDEQATLNGLSRSLTNTLHGYFNGTFIRLVVTGFSRRPILIEGPITANLTLSSRPSIVVIDCTAYFVENYTATDSGVVTQLHVPDRSSHSGQHFKRSTSHSIDFLLSIRINPLH